MADKFPTEDFIRLPPVPLFDPSLEYWKRLAAAQEALRESGKGLLDNGERKAQEAK